MSSGRCTRSRNAPLVVPEELEALADESRRRRGQAPHKPQRPGRRSISRSSQSPAPHAGAAKTLTMLRRGEPVDADDGDADDEDPRWDADASKGTEGFAQSPSPAFENGDTVGTL
eukprot:scaffold1850_cov194-Pinguiococcus_pyrenoidosus.AAC.2